MKGAEGGHRVTRVGVRDAWHGALGLVVLHLPSLDRFSEKFRWNPRQNAIVPLRALRIISVWSEPLGVKDGVRGCWHL